MKQNAQAILLFTGYPLEPIVALQVRKSFQSQAATVAPEQNSTKKVETRKKQVTS